MQLRDHTAAKSMVADELKGRVRHVVLSRREVKHFFADSSGLSYSDLGIHESTELEV